MELEKEFEPSSSVLEGEIRDPKGEDFDEWVQFVRKRYGDSIASSIPSSQLNSGGFERRKLDKGEMVISDNQEVSLWVRLGNAAVLDIESSDFDWSSLSSLHHIKHTTSNSEFSEDESNKALEVTVNSGGVVFIALFNTSQNVNIKKNEGTAVIKIASSRMATQSERLGYEFAKWLGVRTPQARIIHNSTSEWQQIKDAAEKARQLARTAGDDVSEACSELLEALELNRCLLLMNYIHGLPLLENPAIFNSRESAENSANALGKVLMLDLILRNEDRLRCRQLGWRGNYANLLATSANVDLFDGSYFKRSKPDKNYNTNSNTIKERRAISVNGRLISDGNEDLEGNCNSKWGKMVIKETEEGSESCEYYVVAIDSVVPRRPPAGKRLKDQESYPKLVELILNNFEYSSHILYDLSIGKLGFPGPDESSDLSHELNNLSENDMIAIVNAFRAGFKGAIRDLQGFHIFLLTICQKLEGLFRNFISIMNKGIGTESDRDESLDSPLGEFCETNEGFCYTRQRSMRTRSRESFEMSSPIGRESFGGSNKGRNGEFSRNNSSLRLTMRLRDFNKFAKIDAEVSKEMEQWNEMLRNDVVKLCQDNNFNTGFFESTDTTTAVDAYELKVRLEHILERITLISDAASTERPSQITDFLYIGGALAAKSMHTLKQIGVTHILCLCVNELGQSESQFPSIFEYRNFSIPDNDDEDISGLFDETCDFIDYVENLGGKVLVHCFEGRSRSATIVLAYLILRKKHTLLEAWTKLKKSHRRAHPNDGFAKILLNLEKSVHGKVSMEWQQKRPMIRVCPVCGKNAGLSSSSLKLHLQKSHKRISSGSVDSAMTIEIQRALDSLKINRGGSISPKHLQFLAIEEGF
ncbi:hypothetical protein LUZ60_011436 [Juncus effusus]|nr:hypothetical protein LUZ60_011436 [Juncus effusus]